MPQPDDSSASDIPEKALVEIAAIARIPDADRMRFCRVVRSQLENALESARRTELALASAKTASNIRDLAEALKQALCAIDGNTRAYIEEMFERCMSHEVFLLPDRAPREWEKVPLPRGEWEKLPVPRPPRYSLPVTVVWATRDDVNRLTQWTWVKRPELDNPALRPNPQEVIELTDIIGKEAVEKLLAQEDNPPKVDCNGRTISLEAAGLDDVIKMIDWIITATSGPERALCWWWRRREEPNRLGRPPGVATSGKAFHDFVTQLLVTVDLAGGELRGKKLRKVIYLLRPFAPGVIPEDPPERTLNRLRAQSVSAAESFRSVNFRVQVLEPD